jgi:HlyD family secretion protein
MRNKFVFIASGVGLGLAIYAAILSAQQPKAQPPVFQPAANPYSDGIYANGILESDQAQGSNITIYPEVTGAVVKVFAAEGQYVHKGDPLLAIDDTVQRATARQLRAQADAAGTLLAELRAQPRPEILAVAAAQVVNARALLRNATDALDKQEKSYALDPRSVSLDALDNARNAVKIAASSLDVAQKQYDLTLAGAWHYDITNQEQQYIAQNRAAEAAEALLAKYVLRAPKDGIVMTIAAAPGSYVSSQGAYNPYTQGMDPLIVMGNPSGNLAVRTYIDEILLHRLPDPAHIQGRMFIRGTDISIKLDFVRFQPYVSPKIELSDERQELVDVRVLPAIFRFAPPPGVKLYPGQLVDVYVGQK